ncbi:hypothetical protein [Sulfurimonas sp.]
MKTLLMIILSTFLFSNELEWVDEQIKAIKPPRNGINKSKVTTTKNPFIFIKKDEDEDSKNEQLPNTNVVPSSNLINPQLDTNKTSKKNTNFVLNAIINKSALINGKWYKIKDKVNKYTINTIDKTTVLLKYKRKELLLSTQTKNKNLKFRNN